MGYIFMICTPWYTMASKYREPLFASDKNYYQPNEEFEDKRDKGDFTYDDYKKHYLDKLFKLGILKPSLQDDQD